MMLAFIAAVMLAVCFSKASKPSDCAALCASNFAANSSNWERSVDTDSRKLSRPLQRSATPLLVAALWSSSWAMKRSGSSSFAKFSLSSAMLLVKRSMPSSCAAFCASSSLAAASTLARSSSKASRSASKLLHISDTPWVASFCALTSAKMLSSLAAMSTILARNSSTTLLSDERPSCWEAMLRERSSWIAWASTSARTTSMLFLKASIAASCPARCDSNLASMACFSVASSTTLPRKASMACHIFCLSSSLARRNCNASSAIVPSRFVLSSARARSSSTPAMSTCIASE
mmetsp:Transcript_66988/g.187234  ORF Transcript_66988/g.187234 Transcript_66988/m.187234 type:complete len:290 (+) Transcript_66988:636-1505(+)